MTIIKDIKAHCNNVKIKTVILFVFMLFPIESYADYSGSSPAWITTPDYESVSACIKAASPEDTILVSDGNVTWESKLTLTKGINLIGAGAGNTVITSTLTPVIDYDPNSSVWANNYNLRISGFTFNLGGSGQAIQVDCKDTTTRQTNIRIDHNVFLNSTYGGAGIENWDCCGVIDNNTFTNIGYPLRIGWGDNQDSWTRWGEYTYGTANVMYAEDNVFGGSADRSNIITDGDEGGSYVVRYNDFSISVDRFAYVTDAHGDHNNSNLASTRGVVVYSNDITTTYPANVTSLLAHRGGKALAFYNNNNRTSGIFNINPYNNDQCPYDSTHKVNDAYYWNNRKNYKGDLAYTKTPGNTGCSEDPIVDGIDLFNDYNQAEGANNGVRYGTLASIPATCTVGQGYWATDQSCSDLTGMVGKNPTTPISGTLYKCTAPNEWTAYYIPYTYPHPLRKPNPPLNFRIVAP